MAEQHWIKILPGLAYVVYSAYSAIKKRQKEIAGTTSKSSGALNQEPVPTKTPPQDPDAWLKKQQHDWLKENGLASGQGVPPLTKVVTKGMQHHDPLHEALLTSCSKSIKAKSKIKAKKRLHRRKRGPLNLSVARQMFRSKIILDRKYFSI